MKRIHFNLGYVVLMLFSFSVIFNGYYIIGNRMADKAIMAMAGLLKNKTIVIDPGHGGYDPGKIGVGGSKEKDLNLEIALKLAKVLKESGSNVILTRDKDEDFTAKGNAGTLKKRDLDYRLEVVRNTNAQIYLNIQANSYGTTWTGAQTFYNSGNEKGKLLAESIQEEIKRQLKNTTRDALKMNDGQSYVLRNLKDIPATIIETGFLSNAKEEALLKDPQYQMKMAKAIHDGVIKYLMQANQQAD